MEQTFGLNWFVRDWKDALDNSHEVIFEQNIGTISYYFLERLKTKKIKTASEINDKYQLKLLRILQNIINSNGTETKILRRLVPSEIQELGKKPHHPTTKSYIKCFKKIDEAYNNRKFVEAVKAQMLEALDSNKDPDAINKCIKYLTRSLLRRYSIEYLKDEHAKTFTKSFFGLHNDAIRNKMATSSGLHQEETILLNRLYDETHERLGAFSSDPKKYLKQLHLSLSWDRDMFFMISNARKTMHDKEIVDKIKQLGDDASKSDIFALLNQPHLRRNFYAITEKACFSLIFNMVFEPYSKQYNNFVRVLSKLEYCTEFSGLAKSVIHPDNDSPSYNNFNHSAASFAYQIFSKIYSEIMQTKISKDKLQILTTDLLWQLSAFFANESINSDLDALNKFEINKIITEHARNVCHSVFEEALVKMQNATQEYIISQIKQSFTNDLLDHFFDRMDRVPHTCNLTKSQMRVFIDSFCRELQKPREKFRVYCLLGNLDCNQKCFQIGNVTIYDARTWDFGENTTFDRPIGIGMSISEDLQTKYGDPNDPNDDSSPKRNSARAVVDVMAYDYKSAINQAEIKVQKSLNSLAYASTAFATYSGFKPEIPARYMVILNDGESAKVEAKRRQDHHFLIMDDEYLKISKFHSKLILAPSTKFNDSLIRALEWYSRGHWSETTHQKFIQQWVALEQLIRGSLHVKDADSNTLLKYIARLIVTWRDNNYNFSLLQQLRAMMAIIQDKPELRAQLDSNPKLEGWRQNNGIILENLNDVALLANSDVSNYASSISKKLTPAHMEYVEYIIKVIRKHTLFKVDLLRFKRNSLVHRGITYSGELTVMSSELEKILIGVIHALIQFRDKRELSKIIDEINRPFHVRDRLAL